MTLMAPFMALGNTRYTITDGTNLVLSTALADAGYAGSGGLIEVYLEGTIGTNGSGVALTIDDTGADRIIIYNNADIYGYGGDGGGTNGPPQGGGVAVACTSPAELVNSGSINGGGGGGGAQSYGVGGASGGGGGAGLLAGSGGTRATGNSSSNPQSGASGTLTEGGAGGAPSEIKAGDGGDLGQPGEDAFDDRSASWQGAAAGKSITGYSNLTYSGSGTLNGDTA